MKKRCVPIGLIQVCASLPANKKSGGIKDNFESVVVAQKWSKRLKLVGYARGQTLSFYSNLNYRTGLTKICPWELIQTIYIPPKVAVFTWLVFRRACLTQERLQRRGFQICSRCLLCGQEVETNEHFFIHFKITTNLWQLFFCILGVSWVVPKTTFVLFSSWKEVGRRNGT